MKQLESGDFSKAWGGISSVQFALPILWTIAKDNNCNLNDLAIWLAGNPAKLIGKEDSKGKIIPGYDADFIIWDPAAQFVVKEEIIQHKHKITPYLGETLYGVVEQTFLDGELVYNKGTYEHLNTGKIILR